MAEGEYITGGLETNPSDILAGMLADYQARMPGWSPNEGAPEYVLMAITALRHAVRLDVDSQVLAAIFTYFGTSIAGVPFKGAVAATAEATVTIAAGFTAEKHTIEAGLRVTLEGPEGPEEPVTFLVAEAVEVAEGDETATVTLVAQEAGAEGSGLSGDVTILDAREWIALITLTGPTSDGADAEDEATYRNKLKRKMQRNSPTIISPIDAQEAILEIDGIGRCLILNNHVPGSPPEENVPGAFTAIVSTIEGTNVASLKKGEALALVEAERLLELQGHIIDPTRTGVTVEFEFTTNPGFDPEEVKSAGEEAVRTYLDNATWGSLFVAGGAQDWQDETTVRFGEIYGVLNNVLGLNHVLNVKINGVSNTDATLAGPGALPTLTSVIGVPS